MRPSPRHLLGPRAKETACQDAIVGCAVRAGWRVHAERTSVTKSGRHATAIQGHAGFPDLTLTKGRHLWFVELKRSPNTVEPEQVGWLDALTATGAVALVVWVPEEMQAFMTELLSPAPDPTRFTLPAP